MSLTSTIRHVTSFEELVSTPFEGSINALCWQRELVGDFAEIVKAIPSTGNITLIEKEDLVDLNLNEQGALARAVLLEDMKVLEEFGASPTLNLITHYERDATNTFFPTDVYSFHVDRSPVPTFTFLCTYSGAPSEILPNEYAQPKIQIPAIRLALQQEYAVSDADFEMFARENFFDLHYQPLPHAPIYPAGLGNIWKLAVDYPNNPVLPCIHRAPIEQAGEPRLLLIC